MARIFGVGVEKFSLGFGPRLLGKKIGITDYRISAIPLGGYVKMVGEDSNEEINPGLIPQSFSHKHVFKRICIVAAGPVFSFLLAIFFFFSLFYFFGFSQITVDSNSNVDYIEISEVIEGSVAENSGLKMGDKIYSLFHKGKKWPDKTSSRKDFSSFVRTHKNKRVWINILRNGRYIEFDFMYSNKIGIKYTGVVSKKLDFKESFLESVKNVYYLSIFILEGTWSTIKNLEADNLGGPIAIAKMSGDALNVGFKSFVDIIAKLSVVIAIMNLLPIPVLDGGHLVFFSIEAIVGKPVPIKIREKAQMVGMYLLLLLMVFVFYNDIVRYFFN